MITFTEYKATGISQGINNLDKNRRILNKYLLYMNTIKNMEDTQKISKRISFIIKKIDKLKTSIVQYKKTLI